MLSLCPTFLRPSLHLLSVPTGPWFSPELLTLSTPTVPQSLYPEFPLWSLPWSSTPLLVLVSPLLSSSVALSSNPTWCVPSPCICRRSCWHVCFQASQLNCCWACPIALAVEKGVDLEPFSPFVCAFSWLPSICLSPNSYLAAAVLYCRTASCVVGMSSFSSP